MSDKKTIQTMDLLAAGIDRAINGPALPGTPVKKPKYGFALFVYPLEGPDAKKVGNYVSNCEREDMIAAVTETLARLRGNYVENTSGKQNG